VTEFKTYRKKPVEIKAAQWLKSGDHPEVGHWRYPPVDPTTGEISAQDHAVLMGSMRHCDTPARFRRETCTHTMDNHGFIDTLEGGHTVCPGDFVITGIAGEHYSCKPDIFEATYEAVV
jgi:hypothetical protein